MKFTLSNNAINLSTIFLHSNFELSFLLAYLSPSLSKSCLFIHYFRWEMFRNRVSWTNGEFSCCSCYSRSLPWSLRPSESFGLRRETSCRQIWNNNWILTLIFEKMLYREISGDLSRCKWMQDCCIFRLMVYMTVSSGQVIVIINPLALLYSLTGQEFTLSNIDKTKPNETFIITIFRPLVKV